MEETEELSMEKIKRKTDAVSVTTKGIQTRNVKALVGFVSTLGIEIKIAQIKEATEEELQAGTEVKTNPIQDKEKNLGQEKTHLIQENTKEESQTKTTGPRLKIPTDQDQLIQIDQVDQDQDQDQDQTMMNHPKEEKSLKESQAKAETTMTTAELWLHTRQEG